MSRAAPAHSPKVISRTSLATRSGAAVAARTSSTLRPGASSRSGRREPQQAAHLAAARLQPRTQRDAPEGVVRAPDAGPGRIECAGGVLRGGRVLRRAECPHRRAAARLRRVRLLDRDAERGNCQAHLGRVQRADLDARPPRQIRKDEAITEARARGTAPRNHRAPVARTEGSRARYRASGVIDLLARLRRPSARGG